LARPKSLICRPSQAQHRTRTDDPFLTMVVLTKGGSTRRHNSECQSLGADWPRRLCRLGVSGLGRAGLGDRMCPLSALAWSSTCAGGLGQCHPWLRQTGERPSAPGVWREHDHRSNGQRDPEPNSSASPSRASRICLTRRALRDVSWQRRDARRVPESRFRRVDDQSFSHRVDRQRFMGALALRRR
jgi:hypothetical protein